MVGGFRSGNIFISAHKSFAKFIRTERYVENDGEITAMCSHLHAVKMLILFY